MAETIQLSTLRRTLRRTFGFRALREGQEEVIRSILAGRDTLAVMPTGRRQIALLSAPRRGAAGDHGDRLAADLPDEGPGGQAAASWASTPSRSTARSPRARRARSLEEIAKEQREFVFVTPERLAQPEFLATLEDQPDRRLRDRRGALHLPVGARFPPLLPAPAARRSRRSATRRVLALTATATARGGRRHPPPARPRGDGGHRHRRLPREPPLRGDPDAAGGGQAGGAGPAAGGEMEGTGIVYVSTIKDCEAVTDHLESLGFNVARYHGRLGARERKRTQDRFMAGELAGDRRHQRLRHGDRQAGHPLRRPLQPAGLAGVLLPGGGPRRPRRRARPLHPPLPGRRTATPRSSSSTAATRSGSTSSPSTRRWRRSGGAARGRGRRGPEAGRRRRPGQGEGGARHHEGPGDGRRDGARASTACCGAASPPEELDEMADALRETGRGATATGCGAWSSTPRRPSAAGRRSSTTSARSSTWEHCGHCDNCSHPIRELAAPPPAEVPIRPPHGAAEVLPLPPIVGVRDPATLNAGDAVTLPIFGAGEVRSVDEHSL